MQRSIGESAKILLASFRQSKFSGLRWSKHIKFYHFFALTSLLMFLAVVIGLPTYLPKQIASWLTFLVILIIPGFILTQIITSGLKLDLIQQIALAFPMGVAILAIPGLLSLLLHRTINELLLGWFIIIVVLIIIYVILARLEIIDIRSPRFDWGKDEILLIVLLVAGFIYLFPALTTYKIDGDLFTFLSKVSDALAGEQMNVTEPIFGTDLDPGVRSKFNQFLPLWALWAYLSRLDPVILTGFTTRSMFALWALLASYTLGKEVGGGNRRIGLFTVSVQMLIYMINPFFRNDSASLFFFERTNADKFTVSVTMLPAIFALCIIYLRERRRAALWAALICAFAVSSIHPLIATMLALGLAAFGGLHLLLKPAKTTVVHVTHLAGVALVAMALPLILLFMSIGSTPLAPTYPENFEGWLIGNVMSPALPFINLPNQDWYGPLPELSNLTAEEAKTEQNPFLIWRYAANMRRQRLLVFNENIYIADPSIIMEPPYLLGLLLIPFLIRGLRSDIGAQFLVSTSLAIIFVMFNPILTPLIGSIIVPWLLWRFVWLLPYSLIITIGTYRFIGFITGVSSRLVNRPDLFNRSRNYTFLGLIIVLGIAFRPTIAANVDEIIYQEDAARIFLSPERLYSRLNEETMHTGPVTVAANQNLSVTMPVFAPKANIIAHRVFNTSEFFPADQQDIALQRLIDQHYLFNTPYLTENSVLILQRYDVRYIVISSASKLNFQLSLATKWFEWLMDDSSFSLYKVREIPAVTETVRGNSALYDHNWELAEQHFEAALDEDVSDMQALAGLITISRARGDLESALHLFQKIADSNEMPIVQYRLGQLYFEMGQFKQAIQAFEQGIDAAPNISHYHLALGDACLREGNLDCANREFETSVLDISDEVTRIMNLADHWRQRGNSELALSLYEEAFQLKPSVEIQFVLSGAYQDAEMFDRARYQLLAIQERFPLSGEVLFRLGQLNMVQGEIDQAIMLYRRALWLQELKMKNSIQTRIALTHALFDAGQLIEAEDEIDALLAQQPFNASAYILKGDFHSLQNQSQEAVAAYKKALELDPTQIAAYTSLRNEYQDQAALDENLDLLELGAERNPNEPVLFLSLGDQLQRLGSLDTAITVYQLALETLKNQQYSSQFSQNSITRSQVFAYTRIAVAYEDLGRTQSAINSYQAAVAISPFDAQNQVLLGDALRKQNELGPAEEAYRKAIDIDPVYLQAYLQLADLLRSKGDLSKAAEIYGQALNVFFANPTQSTRAITRLGRLILPDQAGATNILMGSASEGQSMVDKLLDPLNQVNLTSFVQALESDDSLASLQLLVQFFERTNQADKALDLYKSKIGEGERNNLSPAIMSQYYSGLGGLLSGLEQYEQAIEAYKKAISLDKAGLIHRLGLAQTFLESGDLNGALMEIQKAFEISPGSIDVQLSHAKILAEIGERERALEIIRSIARSRPGNERANLALARALWESNYWTEAEQTYQKIIKFTPNNANAYFGLANLYLTQARLSQAESLYREAIQVEYTFTSAYLALADLLSRLARYDEAVVVYRQAMQVEPYSEIAFIGLAEVYQNQGRSKEAIEVLKEGAATDPSSVGPLRELASIYRQQNEPELAEEALQQALERSPGNMGVRFTLADLYRSLASDDQALEQLRLAVEEHSESMEALVAYGNELRRQGQVEEAEGYYEHAEQEGQPSAGGFRALAASLQALGRLEEALTLLEQAITLVPNDPINWLAKANVLNQMGEHEAALEALKHATQIAPARAQPWHALGAALLASGQREQGIEALEQAIAAEPTYLPAYGALLDAYLSAGQAEEAAEIVIRARQAVPGSYFVDIYQAQILQSLARWDEAEAALEQAVEKAPGLADPYLAMSTFLNRLIRLKEAISYNKKAISVEPQNTRAYNGLTFIYRKMLSIEETDIPILLSAAYVNAQLEFGPGFFTGPPQLSRNSANDMNWSTIYSSCKDQTQVTLPNRWLQDPLICTSSE